MQRICFTVTLLFLCCFSAKSQDFSKIKALIIIAHPDDESMCAVTTYKITKELKGTVDVAVITNGEAGFKYSTLAENYYGVPLTDSKDGRKYLPEIRKQELMNAGKIIGVSNIFFYDQQDAKYNLDEHDPLDTSWNVPLVMSELKYALSRGHYDYVFCVLPEAGTHAGHKAATLLALRSVEALPVDQRPIILGVSVSNLGDTAKQFSELKNYAETKTISDTALFHMDRTTPFGYNHLLNYKIISNWEMAEHKSQGALEMAFNQGDHEDFWVFKINNKDAVDKTKKLFQRLAIVPYPTKTY